MTATLRTHAALELLAQLDSSLGETFNIEHRTDAPKNAPIRKTETEAERHPIWAKRSPWLDASKPNLFSYEFQLAKEKLPYENFKPLAVYDWIHRHGGESLLLRALARLAPMFPAIAYRDQVAVWISPPPSGLGNAIFMVMGHDSAGRLRLVGGNYFSAPKPRSGSVPKALDFFDKYDRSDDYHKRQLVADTVMQSISPEDKTLLCSIDRECEHFHTMAVYITVLTHDGSLFHAAKAVIEGSKPADFSYEYFGEIK